MHRLVIIALVSLLTGQAVAQHYTLGDTLTVIQRPLLNIPSIVRPGDPLPISCEADPATTGWSASLRRGDLEVPLAIDSASYDPTTLWWTLAVTTPPVPVFDLYDLQVSADGLDDTTRDAVKVFPEFRTDFEVIHITDTHLPTYLYHDQNGADTDSTTSVNLRAITQDINLINPEFVLLTGDLVHEGELEDYLGKRYYSRAQMHINEFDVPVYLTGGNHDLGGWNDTPPPAGTARRDWWRFFGWRRLADPPPGAPEYTQNYSFDYGDIHFSGLESYDNYDSWRYYIYGAESFTSGQFDWLEADLAGAPGSLRHVLFHHFDFQEELNLANLGIDLSLSGHTHRNQEDSTYPKDVLTDNASGINRPFRLVRFEGSDIDVRPTLSAQYDGRLRVAYEPANDGTHEVVTAEIVNGHSEAFHHALLRIAMPAAGNYMVDGGTLTQVDATGDPVICYVEVDLAAHRTVEVTIEADNVVNGVPDAVGRQLSVVPNPFNPQTTVAFELDEPTMCRLTVFDLRGRTLDVLMEGLRSAGRHEVSWNGTDARGKALPSGTYLLGLRAGSYSETRKVQLVR